MQLQSWKMQEANELHNAIMQWFISCSHYNADHAQECLEAYLRELRKITAELEKARQEKYCQKLFKT